MVAFAEQVEVEGCCYKEPQPLVTKSLSQTLVPLRRRLRLGEFAAKNLSL